MIPGTSDRCLDIPVNLCHVLVVGFHHVRGPQLEFAFPPLDTGYSSLSDFVLDDLGPERDDALPLPPAWHSLPFLTMPDGIHQHDTDIVYLTLPSLEKPTLVYGVSCFQQIDADLLRVKSIDVTRSRVQKAVVLILDAPFYGYFREVLITLTKNYFGQLNFFDRTCLIDFHENFHTIIGSPTLPSSALYHHLQLTTYVTQFKYKFLPLFKSLLLERKILIYADTAESVSSFIYALLSLLPGWIESQPGVDIRHRISPNNANSFPQLAYWTKLGFPLDIFSSPTNGQKDDSSGMLSFLFTLQECIFLKKASWCLVGTMNSVFLEHPTDAQSTFFLPDIIVNASTGHMEILAEDMKELHRLSSSDKRFIEEIIYKIRLRNKRKRDSNTAELFEGTDLWIKLQFENYLLSFMSTVSGVLLSQKKHLMSNPRAAPTVVGNTDDSVIESSEATLPTTTKSPKLTMDALTNKLISALSIHSKSYFEKMTNECLSDYSMQWFILWQKTRNYQQWLQSRDLDYYENALEVGHPWRKSEVKRKEGEEEAAANFARKATTTTTTNSSHEELRDERISNSVLDPIRQSFLNMELKLHTMRDAVVEKTEKWKRALKKPEENATMENLGEKGDSHRQNHHHQRRESGQQRGLSKRGKRRKDLRKRGKKGELGNRGVYHSEKSSRNSSVTPNSEKGKMENHSSSIQRASSSQGIDQFSKRKEENHIPTERRAGTSEEEQS